MSEQSAQDKSFDPTPSRIERARREGDMPMSREATGAASYIGLYLAIIIGAGYAAEQITVALAMLHDRPEAFLPTVADAALGAVVLAALAPATIFLAAPAAGTLGALALQQNVVFAVTRIKVKFSRLSPIANGKHKFGPDGISEFLKSFSILAFIAAGFFFVYANRFGALPGAARAPGEAVAGMIVIEAAVLIGAIALFVLIVGLGDVLWVRARHRKRLMMSLEEVKRDAKETEGDPYFKSARRERARAVATNKMLADVPKASVVVVNPEHYAVALRWDGPKGGPPVCVAKGADRMADKIRELAILNGVPIRRDPPTARAIFSIVEVGQEIRREHFAAIAAAIHFAETVRRKARNQ